MYLSDKDIHGKLPELDIDCENPDYPFDANAQIQPCSIDLRLSNVFWKPRTRWGRCIDLRKAKLLERRDVPVIVKTDSGLLMV